MSMTAADLDGDGRTDLILPYRGCHTPCVGVNVNYMKSDFTVAARVGLDIGGNQEETGQRRTRWLSEISTTTARPILQAIPREVSTRVTTRSRWAS